MTSGWSNSWRRLRSKSKRYNGLPRDILREALRRRGLDDIARRIDKGLYEEQLRVGLLNRGNTA